MSSPRFRIADLIASGFFAPFLLTACFSGLVAASELPAPTSAETCEKAIGVVIGVEDKLEKRAFLPYLKHAADRCLSQLGERHPATLAVMGNLASLYRELGRYPEALAFDEASLKVRMATQGERDPDTLIAMNNLALSLGAMGRAREALVLKQKVLAIRKESLGPDHRDTLSAMNNLATTLGELGESDKARELLTQVVRGRQTLLGASHRDTLSAMNNLSATLADLGLYPEAIEVQEKVLALRREHLGADHPETLDSMSNLAINHGELGQYDKALDLKEQVVRLRRARLGETHPDTLSAMNNLANSLGDVGQHAQSQALHEQILALRRSTLGEGHPQTLATRVNLANTLRDQGQNRQAAKLQEETLALMRASQGDAHPDTITLMGNLAVSYGDLGEFEKARALQEQTLRLRETMLGKEHPDTVISMNNLAGLFSKMGLHDKALPLKLESLRIRREKLGKEHPDTLVSLNNLAATYWDLGRQDEALALVAQVVSGVEKQRSSTGLTREQRQTIFAPYSGLYWRYSHWHAQRNQLVRAADLADLAKARTLTDAIRTQAAERALPEAEQAQLSLSRQNLAALRKTLDSLAARIPPDAKALLAAQQALEAAQGSHAGLLAGFRSRYPKYARLTQLEPASIRLAPQLLAASEVFISYSVHENGSAQVFLASRLQAPSWVDLGPLPNLVHSVSAYRLLASGAERLAGQLVQLREGGFQWLGAAQPLPSGARVAAGDAGAARLVLSAYWHEKLIRPVLTQAQGFPRWIISPDKDLALLPFDMLPAAMSSERQVTTASAQTLAQVHNLSLVQSFAVFALLKAREAEYAGLPRGKQLLAMGNAVYSPVAAGQGGFERGAGEPSFVSEVRGASASKGSAAMSSGAASPEQSVVPLAVQSAAAEQYAMSRVRWQNLPGTALEVNAVARSFASAGTPGNVDLYLADKASEAGLQALQARGSLKHYRYLLFSAHGYLAQNPALSALVLSQQGNPPGVDGYVTADEWPQYDMRSDLTVLSACDTGVGKAQAGESVMGLPYALFVAGNKNTLLSLWPVSDEATAEFMSRFFARLVAGTGQSEALALTKREFQTHERWNHPRYWAAFVLYGV